MRPIFPALLLLASLAVTETHAAEYFVDPVNGSNSNNGSSGSPWQTLQTVIDTKTLNPGDTVWLRNGYHGSLTISNKNKSGIVTLAAQAGHTPQIKKVSVTSSSNWRLRGFTVSPRFGPSPDSGLAVRLSGSDLFFEDSTVKFGDDSSGWSQADWLNLAGNGIEIGGTRITVTNNLVLNSAFAIGGSATHSLVRGNRVVNFRGDGLRGLGNHTVWEYNLVKNCFAVDGNHDDGFQSWTVGSGGVGTGEVTGVVLRGNVIINYEDPNQPHRGALQGIGCFDGTFVDWIVENNVVITDHWHGITLLGARNCRIVNNTVMDPNHSTPGPCWIQIGNHKNGTAPSGCLVRNNIAHTFNSSSTGVTQDHNLTLGNRSLFFVDPDAYNLRLKAGSPAIDAGIATLAPATDIDGVARPQGAAFDAGAYEYASNQAPAVQSGPEATPNPTQLKP